MTTFGYLGLFLLAVAVASSMSEILRVVREQLHLRRLARGHLVEKPKPTAGDPLAQAKTVDDLLSIGVQGIVERHVRNTLRGRTSTTFNGLADQDLAMELISRGWVAYRPSDRGDPK